MKLSGEVLIDASADTAWENIGHRPADIGAWATAIEASYAEPGARPAGYAGPASARSQP